MQLQLDALGDCHVGYRHMALPHSSISLVGARPFSKVRDDWGILIMDHNSKPSTSTSITYRNL